MRAVGAAVLLALGGCTMGPDYVKPTVSTPGAYRFAEASVAETANTAWWKQFGDPVLDALIDEALTRNYNVKIAAANVEQAAAVLVQARSQFYPQASYGASATRQRASDAQAPARLQQLLDTTSNQFQVLAGASWEIDLWGRVRRLSEAARANLLATEQARRGVILSLVSEIASTYLQLRGLDHQLEIAQRTRDSYAETVKLFELQAKYGMVSQMNVEQARSSYETAAAQIPLIESQIAQTENGLSVLLGRDPGPIPRGRTIAALTSPGVPAGLPSQLLERRPDIAQAEQALISANAQIGAAKALYFPTISLTGAYGVSSRELDDLFSGAARIWSFAGQVTGPIFTGGAIRGQVAQATAAQQASLLSYQATIQSAFSDVENALVARQKLLEQQAAQQRLVRALSEYERLATLQYKGGYTPYSTVLQAQQGLFPQELNLAQTQTAVHTAMVNLYKATGGGWVDIARATADGPPVTPAAAMTPVSAATVAASAPREDRVEARVEAATSIVDVYHERGVGGARITAPASGWPPALLVRLHLFPALESFTAASSSGSLDCTQARAQRDNPRPSCRMNGMPVDAVRAAADYFEVTLPHALLPGDGGAVDLRWVDRWR